MEFYIRTLHLSW